jgi:hypothetical protein
MKAVGYGLRRGDTNPQFRRGKLFKTGTPDYREVVR